MFLVDVIFPNGGNDLEKIAVGISNDSITNISIRDLLIQFINSLQYVAAGHSIWKN